MMLIFTDDDDYDAVALDVLEDNSTAVFDDDDDAALGEFFDPQGLSCW